VGFAWAAKAPTPHCIQAARHQLSGDRDHVRRQAVRIALEGLLAALATD
jgi:nicotinamide mononucleotide (NMN) deamidase PncC